MIFERFQTAVVPFPFADVAVLKRRPVVVLSGAEFNGRNGTTLAAMITTAKQTSWPSDIEIRDLESAGLRTPCVIRMRLVTMPNGLFLRGLGRLGALDRLACERAVAEMLVG